MQSSYMVPQGFGQPLAPGTPLPKGVQNKQVRFANQPQPAPPTIPAIPATGVPTQAGGKRIRRNSRKKRRTNRMRKSRRRR